MLDSRSILINRDTALVNISTGPPDRFVAHPAVLVGSGHDQKGFDPTAHTHPDIRIRTSYVCVREQGLNTANSPVGL